MDTIGQLQKINRHANDLLDMLMRSNQGDAGALQFFESWARKICACGAEDERLGHKLRDPRELALKAMHEIRGQLKLQFEISQALFDIQAVKEFQSQVLEVIGSVSPEARDDIIRKLTEGKALRSAVDFD